MVRVLDGDEFPELHVRHHEVPLAKRVHAPEPLLGELAPVVLGWKSNILKMTSLRNTDLE